MNTGNAGYTGNTGYISPFYSPGNTGHMYHCPTNDCFWQLNQQPFHPWEVALTVVAAVALVATVVLFFRRLREA